VLVFMHMNQDKNFQESEKIEEIVPTKHFLHTVTPVSKYLALSLFIVLPFVGGWIGYSYSPEKFVEVLKEVEVPNLVEVDTPYQEVSIQGDDNLRVFINPVEPNEPIVLSGSGVCQMPVIQTVDLTIETGGQKMEFTSIGVPVFVKDKWPLVSFIENTGMLMYEDADIEATPIFGIGENTLFIPDYNTMTVSEVSYVYARPASKNCLYEFSEYDVVYYYGGNLLKDTRVPDQSTSVGDVVELQNYSETTDTPFKPYCFRGCG